MAISDPPIPNPWLEFSKTFNDLWPVFDRAAHAFDGLVAVLSGRYRRPRNGPGPLCIDGNAYRRRQRNRVKRKK